MPRLTQIKETKKGRLALFLDGEFTFSLDEETFAAAYLHEGDEIETSRMEELHRKSDTRRAVDQAMEYLSLRDHASGELYQKLCRKFDAHSAAYAVAKVQELGLLDDEAAARRRAAELLRKHKSRREIYHDLLLKGISAEQAENALESLFEGENGADAELDSAAALIEKSYRRKLAEGRSDAVFAALARRGFSATIIRQAIAKYAEE